MVFYMNDHIKGVREMYFFRRKEEIKIVIFLDIFKCGIIFDKNLKLKVAEPPEIGYPKNGNGKRKAKKRKDEKMKNNHRLCIG